MRMGDGTWKHTLSFHSSYCLHQDARHMDMPAYARLINIDMLEAL
jgi:hypothetical protein